MASPFFGSKNSVEKYSGSSLGQTPKDRFSLLYSQPSLDYSFLNISNLVEVENGNPQPRRTLRRTWSLPSGRYLSNVIRLSNNKIMNTSGLYKMALNIVEYPETIAWLDLSFNHISHISQDILQFQGLKKLCLHGNKIKGFPDIQKLRQLTNLYSLTLYGNPLVNSPNYRSKIIYMFPLLESLDLTKITGDEKDKARLQIQLSPSKIKKFLS